MGCHAAISSHECETFSVIFKEQQIGTISFFADSSLAEFRLDIHRENDILAFDLLLLSFQIMAFCLNLQITDFTLLLDRERRVLLKNHLMLSRQIFDFSLLRQKIRFFNFQHLMKEKTVSSYPTICGINKFTRHFAIGLAASSTLSSRYSSIEAIIGTGSIARGFGDSVSDIDLFLISREYGSQQIPSGEFQYEGFAVDLKSINLSEDPIDSWNMVRKWCVEEGVVIFSRNPNSTIEILDDLMLGETEKFDHIQCLVLHIGWTGFQPLHWHRKFVRGYDWPTSSYYWLTRGDVISSQKTVDRAMDYLINILFLINENRYPGAKWKYNLVKELNWLPLEFASKFNKIQLRTNEASNFQLRAALLQSIVDEVFEKLEESDLLAANIYSHASKLFAEGNAFIDEYR